MKFAFRRRTLLYAQFLLTLSCLFSSLAFSQAGITTMTTDSPTAVVIANYNAGDTVTITGEIDTSDPNEEGEGEDLIISTSTNILQGYQDISVYSQPFVNVFTASGAGTVSAFVNNADGDELATIIVVTGQSCSTTVPTPVPSPPNCPVSNWTPNQKRTAGYVAVASSSIGTGLLTQGVPAFFCSIFTTAAPACLTALPDAAWLLGSANAFLGVYAGFDPPDSNYMVIAQPTFPQLTPVVPDANITPALAAALNALNTNSAASLAYTQAAITSQNRTAGAANAGDAVWEAKQFQAQQSYAAVLVSLVQAEPLLLANLQAALAAGYPGSVIVTPADVVNAETEIAADGPPAAVLQAWTQAGLDTATMTLLTDFFIGQNANNVAATFPAQLTNPALAAAVNAFVPPPALQQIGGALTQVSVGADGSVWGINSSQQIYTYDSTASAWTNLPGSLRVIAAGSSSAVWGLNYTNQVYRWDAVNMVWVNIPGELNQIAVGADGDVWGLNYQGRIYHYNSASSSWTPVGGALTSISVGSAGAVCGLNSGGGIFCYNPGFGAFQYIAGTVAFTQISVGVDGDLWAVKNNLAYHYDVLHNTLDVTPGSIAQVMVGSGAAVFGLDSSGNVFQWSAQAQAWVQISGTLSSLAVGANGQVWGVDSSQNIFQLTNSPTRAYQALSPVPGNFTQISVGSDGSAWAVDSSNLVYNFNSGTQTFQAVSGAPALAQLSVGAGADVWGVDTSGDIFEYNATAGTWNEIPGQLTSIQVGANMSVWGINAAGSTYTYNASSSSWTQIPGQLATLSVGADGTVWGINAGGQIYRFDSRMQSWVNVAGTLTQISVGSATNIWGVNAQQQVFRYDTSAKDWAIIPGSILTTVKVAFDGSIWGTNPEGSLYQWNSNTQSFSLVANGVTNVVVGNAAAVWALDSTSGQTFLWF
ncbi:MAG TPA: tectonin domain-containing protein [Bryobacteraceae bacterium]|jgi:hypothetical protein|nr:tectonin domain-containing protein [Bryobacteraceae bacterium]